MASRMGAEAPGQQTRGGGHIDASVSGASQTPVARCGRVDGRASK